ncbi:efflux RND transporter periplasmic adaptor subunit [Cohnella zeiphila]|uniref:Efflux RND transporter periplasmic adaptor subunit n=1 Tax=Cohnella zeiphila TaxID=2761120 RepID=A0A7X0VVJ6_9BACL|nr:efflux RND transporter periplasmic adaptor subunit [Cohnella zeiphila]MBB6729953.1 efflux RND transporter periplasmic adaptor subunit [Cohnella zeiphila]
MHRRKIALRWAIGVFFGSLLVLTFLSNTIQSLTLPKVAVETPDTGSLDLSVDAEGYLQPAYTAQLIPLGSWTVSEVKARKGDRVKKGDSIVTFDTTTTQRSLEDEQARRKQEQIRLEQLQDALKLLMRGDDQDAIERQKRDMESQQLSLDMEQRKVEELERQISDGQVLRAPTDGVVESLNVEAGANVSPGQPVGTIASDASGYQFVISASGDAGDALSIGDKVTVQVDGADAPQTQTAAGVRGKKALSGPDVRQLQGTISTIEEGGDGADSDAKRVTVDISGTDLSPGLKATAYIPRQSQSPGLKISTDALKSDDNGTYVFAVTDKEGPLGSSYFAEKAYVTTGEQTDDTVLILNGLGPDERVVTDASEPLSDGDRVRLE